MSDSTGETLPQATDIPASGIGGARLQFVVLDCEHPVDLAVFYATLLGWEVKGDDTWAEARERGTDRPARGIAFQFASDFVPPTWPETTVPQQAHLDIAVAQLAVAEEAVLGLGATRTGLPSADSPAGRRDAFRVYLDPAGHPFCLVRDA